MRHKIKLINHILKCLNHIKLSIRFIVLINYNNNNHNHMFNKDRINLNKKITTLIILCSHKI